MYWRASVGDDSWYVTSLPLFPWYVYLTTLLLAYIPQGNRFNIYGDFGCVPAIYQTWVAVVLYLLPPILIGCVSAVYCGMSPSFRAILMYLIL